MKLAQAIRLSRECELKGEEPFRVFLACGFMPQHLKTFLQSHLFLRLKDRRVVIETGRYGDLAGSMEAIADVAGFDAVVVVLEWSDLDARLGYRTTHGWRPDCVEDFSHTSHARLTQFRGLVERVSEHSLVCVALPTLPLPPAFIAPTRLGGCDEFVLHEQLMTCAAALSAIPGVRVMNPQKIDATSPLDNRLDLGTDILSGFPYTLEHASALCRLLAELTVPPPPKKAIVTDLDDTLWRGILGEDGIEGISWDLSRCTHGHALYQEMLASLAQMGVLIGVATKNDPDLVECALDRSDLVIPRDRLFPVCAGWGPKSESMRQILATWNIGADSVAFVDDSPLELAEVSAAFPDVQCLQFPVRDDLAIYGFLQTLRDLCGKATVTDEDQLRLASIRASSRRADAAAGVTPDDFLKSAEAEITLTYDQPNTRILELINKTNQFNLNGRRYEESAWKATIAEPGRFLLSVSYKDKFGPLGEIAAVSGVSSGGELLIDIWVMSCRAFSRRIEFETLNALFDRFGTASVRLDMVATDRNGPFRECVAMFGPCSDASSPCITKAAFVAACPNLYARVIT